MAVGTKEIEINAIKTTIIRESNQELSKLLEESTSTHDGPFCLSSGEMVDDDSLETTMINSIALNHNIVGSNSRLTNEYQMSDPNLKWISDIIKSNANSGSKVKVTKKNLDATQKKLLKLLPKLKILKNLIYLVEIQK